MIVQLFVQTAAGATLTVELDESESVGALKGFIANKSGIPSLHQRLVCQGVPLEDGESLASYDIANESTVFVNHQLLGGAKKRKKKNYTTPKKIKHKKKKEKLSVLKFYRVEDSGRITRLRRECEGPICGAGVFMANHHDRHYCGRCGLTLVYNKPVD